MKSRCFSTGSPLKAINDNGVPANGVRNLDGQSLINLRHRIHLLDPRNQHLEELCMRRFQIIANHRQLLPQLVRRRDVGQVHHQSPRGLRGRVELPGTRARGALLTTRSTRGLAVRGTTAAAGRVAFDDQSPCLCHDRELLIGCPAVAFSSPRPRRNMRRSPTNVGTCRRPGGSPFNGPTGHPGLSTRRRHRFQSQIDNPINFPLLSIVVAEFLFPSASHRETMS